jgi:hypothetical protein
MSMSVRAATEAIRDYYLIPASFLSSLFHLLQGQILIGVEEIVAEDIPSPTDLQGLVIQVEQIAMGEEHGHLFRKLPAARPVESRQVIFDEVRRFVPVGDALQIAVYLREQHVPRPLSQLVDGGIPVDPG